MRSLISSVTLLGVAVLANSDFFIQNVNKHRNMSVDPCDNFFRHACSSGIDDSEKFVPRTVQLMREQQRKGEQINLGYRNQTHFEVLLRNFTENPALFSKLFELVNRNPHHSGYATIRLFKNLRERMNYLAVADRDLSERNNLMREIYDYAKTEFEQSVSSYTPEQIKFFLGIIDRLRYDVSSDYSSGAYALILHKLGIFFDKVKVLEEFTPGNIEEKLPKFLEVMTLYGLAINGLSSITTRIIEIDSFLDFNAAYYPSLNHVFIPDSIFTLTKNITAASLYGSVGVIMSHEFYHAFQKREFWDKQHLGESGVCIQNHMANVCNEYKEKSCESGLNTYLEDGADVEGVQLAYKLFKRSLGGNMRAKVDGTNVTHQQMFFYTYANVWCDSDDRIDQNIEFDPHSAKYVRVNGAVSLLDAFHDAFQCKTGDRMMNIAEGREQCNTFGTPVRR